MLHQAISWKFWDFFILKRTTQIIVCSPFSTQRPTLPIRHKNSQNTALSLYCPSCCQRALRRQVDDKKMTALGEPWAKGRTIGKRTKRTEQRWKCTKRTNLYFDKQNNYLHDFGGGFCTKRIQNGQKHLWVGGGLISDANGRKVTLAL